MAKSRHEKEETRMKAMMKTVLGVAALSLIPAMLLGVGWLVELAAPYMEEVFYACCHLLSRL